MNCTAECRRRQSKKKSRRTPAIPVTTLFIASNGKARENPLQTVAIAAGLAYPAWRLLINIPAPILLVGAGLARSNLADHLVRRTGAKPPRAERDGKGEQFTDSLKRTAQDVSSNLSQAADGLKEKVTDAAEQARTGVSEGLGAIRSRAAAAISDTTKTARAAASDTVTAATEAVSATYRSGIDAASRTGDQLSESFQTVEGESLRDNGKASPCWSAA